jgi:hypothetical protein
VRDEIKISDEPERGDPGGSYMREETIPDVLRRKYGVERHKTLRDEFAMAALTGLLGSHDYMRIPESQLNRERVCENVYEWADHMLRAREARE